MKIMNVFIGILLVLPMSTASFSWAQSLRVGTSLAPPYQVKDGDKLSGSVVDVIQCALDKSSTPFQMSVLPWKRATNNLKTGKLDLIFSYTNNDEIGSYAHFSAPLVLEKWYWYGKNASNSAKKDKSIAVILGSNQESWLINEGFTNIKAVSSIANSLLMMDTSRVSGILVDQQLALSATKSTKIDLEHFNPTFQRFSSLGAYVSNQYIAKHPDFLPTLNKNILSCKPVGISLDENTFDVLKRISEDIQQWVDSPMVIAAIVKANTQHNDISDTEILALDQKWRSEVKSNQLVLISSVLENDLSHYLKKIKQDANGLFSEIFIMDNKGLNVGQSDITSDFWQGDEDKFQNSFSTLNNKPFIDDIEYDASSQTFQSQVSLPIIAPDTKTKIGAITVGINIEKALNKIQ